MSYLIAVNPNILNKNDISFEQVVIFLQDAWKSVVANYFHALKNSSFCNYSGAEHTDLRESLPKVIVTGHESLLFNIEGNQKWELSEVHRQMCQVEVLIEALRLIQKKHPKGKITDLSPTQQSGVDAAGTDRNGKIWVLEAFGGINVRNNGKIGKNVASLMKKTEATHRYFACFGDAWLNYDQRERGKFRFEPVADTGPESRVLLKSVVLHSSSYKSH